MITLEQAKILKAGQILVDDAGKKWKVSGKVKTWAKDASKVRVPLKHGMYSYGYLTERNLHLLSFPAEDSVIFKDLSIGTFFTFANGTSFLLEVQKISPRMYVDSEGNRYRIGSILCAVNPKTPL